MLDSVTGTVAVVATNTLGAPAPIAPLRRNAMTDLGPNQLAWLRENVPAFKPAEQQVSDARRHTEEVERQLKGSLPR